MQVIRCLLAAGLQVSWFTTENNENVIVRVSAQNDRLSEEAESLDPPFLVRSQVPPARPR